MFTTCLIFWLLVALNLSLCFSSSTGLWRAEGNWSCSSWGQGQEDPGWFVIYLWDAEQTHQEVLWRVENESLPRQVHHYQLHGWNWSNINLLEVFFHSLLPSVPTELCSWNPPYWCWMNPLTTWTLTPSSGSTSTKQLFDFCVSLYHITEYLIMVIFI